jgi:hypothetical protein
MITQYGNTATETRVYEMRTGAKNNFYTLWFVSYGSETIRGVETYIKNLSINYEEAFKEASEKAKNRGIELMDCSDEVDSILRGEDVVKFGKYRGTKIIDLPNSYLNWLAQCGIVTYTDNYNKEREICKCSGELHDLVMVEVIKRGLYQMFEGKLMASSLINFIENKRKMQGHFFTEKEKIKGVEVECISVKSYDVSFGYQSSLVYIYELKTKDNQILVYKGGKCEYDNKLPDNIYIDQILGQGNSYINKGSKFILSGTIEHGEYKEQKQTYIKRPKFLLPESVIQNYLQTV